MGIEVSCAREAARCVGRRDRGAEAPAAPSPRPDRGRRIGRDGDRGASRRPVEHHRAPTDVGPLATRLRAAVAGQGRDPRAVLTTACFRLIVREGTPGVAARIADLDPGWRDDPDRIVGDVPAVPRAIREYADSGADGLIVHMPGPYDFTTLEHFVLAARLKFFAGKSSFIGIRP